MAGIATSLALHASGLAGLLAQFAPGTSDEPCGADASICRQVLSWTGNETAAQVSDALIGTPLRLLGLAVLGFLVRWALHRMVDRLVARAEEGVLPDRVARMSLGQLSVGQLGQSAQARDEATGATTAAAAGSVAQSRRVQRAQAMGSLLKSIVSGVVVAVIVTMMLSEVGVDIGPVVASAGILGVALGFGSQSLVKDFLSGIFMIFEDQYGVGDVVDLGEATGTVEAVSLRVTRLRDLNGTVWYVRNGEILRVGNRSQNWARSLLDVNVGHDADLVQVRRVLQELAEDLWQDEDYRDQLVELPEVWGIEAITPEAITVRMTLKTAPQAEGAVAREMRSRILARFAHEGIDVPRQRATVWHPGAPAAGME